MMKAKPFNLLASPRKHQSSSIYYPERTFSKKDSTATLTTTSLDGKIIDYTHPEQQKPDDKSNPPRDL